MKANLLPLLGMLLLAQCKKKEPTPPADPLATLPPETRTGAGTFGCLINGQAYYTPFSTLTAGSWTSQTRLSVSADMYENGKYTGVARSLSLVNNGQLANSTVFNIISAATTYPTFTAGLNQFFAFSGGNSCLYGGAYFKNGQVTLTKFDGVARIASGRFAFILYEPSGCDTLRVTDGRFDIKF